MGEKVICSNCGLLAVLHKQSGEYVSPDKRYRDAGDIPHIDGKYIYVAHPFCSVNVIDFHKLAGPNLDENDATGRRKHLQEPRDCEKFVEWNPCFSPKEQKQMLLNEKMLESQREWQATEAKKADERHRETIRVAMASSQSNVRSNVIAGVIGAVAALFAAAIGAAALYLTTRH
jgi:hypothetical protein